MRFSRWLKPCPSAVYTTPQIDTAAVARDQGHAFAVGQKRHVFEIGIAHQVFNGYCAALRDWHMRRFGRLRANGCMQ